MQKRPRRLLRLYFGALLLAIATMLMLVQLRRQRLTTSRDLPTIVEEGVLHLAVEYNPLSYTVSGDSLMGFDYELSRLLANESGLEVAMHPVASLAESLAGLNAGQYDVVARPLAITTDNQKAYAFTIPVLQSQQVLVQRKAAFNAGKKPIRNQLELAAETLHIAAQSPTLLHLHNLAKEMGDTIYIKEESRLGDEQLIMMVARGGMEYAVCNRSIAEAMAADYPEIDFETPVSFTQRQAWALRKASPLLLDSLNCWLRRICETEDFKRIEARYFN